MYAPVFVIAFVGIVVLVHNWWFWLEGICVVRLFFILFLLFSCLIPFLLAPLELVMWVPMSLPVHVGWTSAHKTALIVSTLGVAAG